MNLNPLPLLAGVKTYLIVGAVSAAVAFTGGAYSGYRWEHGALTTLQRDDALALVAAVQKAKDSQHRQDEVDKAAAVNEAYAQGKLQAQVIIIRKEIPVHVTAYQDATVCVPVGLLRIMRASATGADPDALELAPGQSDDDCAQFTVSAVASVIAEVYAAGRANAEQLTALQAWVIANHEAQGETHAGSSASQFEPR